MTFNLTSRVSERGREGAGQQALRKAMQCAGSLVLSANSVGQRSLREIC